MFPEELSTDRLNLQKLSFQTISPFELYEHVNEDAEDINEITEYLSWEPHVNIKETEDFIKHTIKLWNKRETITYVIFINDEFAGLTSLDISWPKKRGELGIWLRKPFWGKGFSQERASAILDLAFNKLDLKIVSVSHFKENKKSEKAIKKYINNYNGQCDGILRNWVPTNNDVKDVCIYTISKEQYIESIY